MSLTRYIESSTRAHAVHEYDTADVRHWVSLCGRAHAPIAQYPADDGPTRLPWCRTCLQILRSQVLDASAQGMLPTLTIST